jgi:hypothetical protein
LVGASRKNYDDMVNGNMAQSIFLQCVFVKEIRVLPFSMEIPKSRTHFPKFHCIKVESGAVV